MMKSLVCVDANITIKLIIQEPDSWIAQSLWEAWTHQAWLVVAPALWSYEVTSVIRKNAYRGLLLPDEETEAFASVQLLGVELLTVEGLHQRAWELARHFNRPTAYDAHYLALAELLQCPFWTADERLFNAVRHELGWVRWLGNYQIQEVDH